jgi:ABC-type sugar transport system ATPase subunit
MIALRGVTKTYGPTVALAGVDLDLRPGEVLGIAGPNGAGKSTLVRMIAGEERATAGTITRDGVPWSPFDDWQSVAVVHQEPQLFPNLTVAENVMVGREGTWGYPRLSKSTAGVMAAFGIAGQANRQLGDCSLATQQRTEIARAVDRAARVFLFDEPNSALTNAESDALFAEIRALAAAGNIVVLITHRLQDFVRHCARVVVVRDGRVRATLEGTDLTEDAIARELVTGNQAVSTAVTGQSEGAPVFNVTGWSHPTAFRDLALKGPAGRILALVGVEGSGARELLRSLAGLEPVSGQMTIDALSGRAAIDRLAAYVPATRATSLYSNFSVGENLLARLGRPQIAGFALALKVGQMRKLAEAAVERFMVKARSVDQPIRSLSGGNQQKVAIAQALAREPRLLLLEEPTRGVDIHSKAEIYRLLRDHAAAGHAVVIYCTEVLEVFEAADHVQVMSEGRLSAPEAVAGFADVEDLASRIGQLENQRHITGGAGVV